MAGLVARIRPAFARPWPTPSHAPMPFVRLPLPQGFTEAQDRAIAAGVRPADVVVVLIENGSADWAFGDGEAQVLRPGTVPHRTAES